MVDPHGAEQQEAEGVGGRFLGCLGDGRVEKRVELRGGLGVAIGEGVLGVRPEELDLLCCVGYGECVIDLYGDCFVWEGDH